MPVSAAVLLGSIHVPPASVVAQPTWPPIASVAKGVTKGSVRRHTEIRASDQAYSVRTQVCAGAMSAIWRPRMAGRADEAGA